MNKTGGTDEDMAARRKKAQQAFASLHQSGEAKTCAQLPKLEFSTPMLRQFSCTVQRHGE